MHNAEPLIILCCLNFLFRLFKRFMYPFVPVLSTFFYLPLYFKLKIFFSNHCCNAISFGTSNNFTRNFLWNVLCLYLRQWALLYLYKSLVLIFVILFKKLWKKGDGNISIVPSGNNIIDFDSYFQRTELIVVDVTVRCKFFGKNVVYECLVRQPQLSLWRH